MMTCSLLSCVVCVVMWSFLLPCGHLCGCSFVILSCVCCCCHLKSFSSIVVLVVVCYLVVICFVVIHVVWSSSFVSWSAVLSCINLCSYYIHPCCPVVIHVELLSSLYERRRILLVQR